MPAKELADGSKEWWFEGQQHRDGGLPAIESHNGNKEWWFKGQQHRDGGLPVYVSCDYTKQSWLIDDHIIQVKYDPQTGEVVEGAIPEGCRLDVPPVGPKAAGRGPASGRRGGFAVQTLVKRL